MTCFTLPPRPRRQEPGEAGPRAVVGPAAGPGCALAAAAEVTVPAARTQAATTASAAGAAGSASARRRDFLVTRSPPLPVALAIRSYTRRPLPQLATICPRSPGETEPVGPAGRRRLAHHGQANGRWTSGDVRPNWSPAARSDSRATRCRPSVTFARCQVSM